MYHNTITLFNYHKATDKWYPSVISGVDLISNKASTATKEGVNNGDTVDIIVHCTRDRVITTSEGRKATQEQRLTHNVIRLLPVSPLHLNRILFMRVNGLTYPLSLMTSTNQAYTMQ